MLRAKKALLSVLLLVNQSIAQFVPLQPLSTFKGVRHRQLSEPHFESDQPNETCPGLLAEHLPKVIICPMPCCIIQTLIAACCSFLDGLPICLHCLVSIQCP